MKINFKDYSLFCISSLGDQMVLAKSGQNIRKLPKIKKVPQDLEKSARIKFGYKAE